MLAGGRDSVFADHGLLMEEAIKVGDIIQEFHLFSQDLFLSYIPVPVLIF